MKVFRNQRKSDNNRVRLFYSNSSRTRRVTKTRIKENNEIESAKTPIPVSRNCKRRSLFCIQRAPGYEQTLPDSSNAEKKTSGSLTGRVLTFGVKREGSIFYQFGRIPIFSIRRSPYLPIQKCPILPIRKGPNPEGPIAPTQRCQTFCPYPKRFIFTYLEGSHFFRSGGVLICQSGTLQFYQSRRVHIFPIWRGPNLTNRKGPIAPIQSGQIFSCVPGGVLFY